MDRYPSCVNYLVLFLLLLHTLASGHLVCYAHFLPTQPEQHVAYCCDHPCCPPPEENLPVHYCQNDTCHSHHCNENKQPAIRTSRCIDETVNLMPVLIPKYISSVVVVPQSVIIGFLDTVARSPSALPLRLHLLCKVLLI